jgi:ribonuclease BN (tRNA processing enzyme)
MREPTRRRAFLRQALGLVAAGALCGGAGAEGGRTRLILLGTGGGPRPRRNSSASAQVIVAGGRLFVVDCGDGVARQIVLAGLSLADLRHVFITHHHSDHEADYGNLLLLAWPAGLKTRVDTWGPPPLERMTRLFFEMNAEDIRVRIADEGRAPLQPLVHPHELRRPGRVMQEDGMTVTAALVRHPMVATAFAYRFDAPDRSIVISGDTAPSDDLIALARGADVLVHEAMDPDGAERLAARMTQAADLRRHLRASHTTTAEAGRIAAAAGVKTLVLSHFVPADDPAITDEMWAAPARAAFGGRVIVGKDLMEI